MRPPAGETDVEADPKSDEAGPAAANPPFQWGAQAPQCRQPRGLSVAKPVGRAEKQATERYEAPVSPAETRGQRLGKRDNMNQLQMTYDIFHRTMMSWDNVNLAKRFGSRQSGS